MSEDTTYEWYEKATIAFAKLSPKKGDFITITIPANTDPRQAEMVAIMLQEALEDNLPEGVHAIVLQGDIRIEDLSKEVMASHGWYKIGGQ